MSPVYPEQVLEWTDYVLDDSVSVMYYIDYEGDLIKPGSRICLKNDTREVIFRAYVVNPYTGETYMECWIDGQYTPVKIERLKGLKTHRRNRTRTAI